MFRDKYGLIFREKLRFQINRSLSLSCCLSFFFLFIIVKTLRRGNCTLRFEN